MKNIKLLTVFLVLSVLILYSCCECNKKKNVKHIPVVGEYSWIQWENNAGWHDYSASKYHPDKDLVEELKTILQKNKNISFLLFPGSWCPDSEKGVPEIIKLLKLCNFDINTIKIYGVDRQKTEPTGTAVKYKIERVPTLVILKNGKEIGRIVEFPILSWADDIITILTEK